MKKLLSSVCMSVFVLSLSASFAHAMGEDKEQFERSRGMKRARPINDVQQLVNIAQSHPLESLYVPEEMWGHIILFKLAMEPKSLPNFLNVCQQWNTVTKSLPVSLAPWCHDLTNEILGQFRNVATLYIFEDADITDDAINLVTNLETLIICFNPNITDSSIKFLTNLTDLDLVEMNGITDEGMKPLIKLRNLTLKRNKNMTGIFLQDCKDLTNLNLHCDSYITDENIKNLTSLTNLNLKYNKKITDEGVMLLTNLRRLKLCSSNITNNGISHLRSLTYLKIEHDDNITDEGIKFLTNLTTLNVEKNSSISWLGIRHLTNLTDWEALKGGQYGQNFVNHFEDDAPDFGMWDDEAVQVYAELIEQYPHFSDIMDEKESREALEKLFEEKGLDSSILTEDYQFQKYQRAQELEELEYLAQKEKELESSMLIEIPLLGQEDKQALEREKELEELETLTMDVDSYNWLG